VNRAPRVFFQCIIVNVRLLLTILKQVPEMSYLGLQARVTPNKHVVHCMSLFSGQFEHVSY
jgi:hypothetical protein